MCLADLDNDGRLDFAIANGGTGLVDDSPSGGYVIFNDSSTAATSSGVLTPVIGACTSG